MACSDQDNNKSSQERKLVRQINRDYVLISVEEFERYRQWAESKIKTKKILKFFSASRSFLVKVGIVSLVLGVIVSFLIAPQFTSVALLMPEYKIEASSGGNMDKLLQDYGGMLGIGNSTYASSSNAIRVELYPEIVSSLPFQLDLIEHEFYYPVYDTTVSVATFFEELYEPSIWDYVISYTIGLPSKVKTLVFDWFSSEFEDSGEVSFQKDEIVVISPEKMKLIKWMRQQVSTSLDQESGIVSIKATMPTSKLSADIAQKTIDNLTDYLVKYRAEKIKVDLAYLEKEHAKAEQQFNKIRDSLALFRDQNRFLSTAKAQTEEQQLQSRYDLAFNLYNGLSQKLEETKLRLQEETPVFEVLEPVQIPIERSSPNRILIVLLFFLGGFFGAMGCLLLRLWYGQLAGQKHINKCITFR